MNNFFPVSFKLSHETGIADENDTEAMTEIPMILTIALTSASAIVKIASQAAKLTAAIAV
jgi:hypothetical protein